MFGEFAKAVGQAYEILVLPVLQRAKKNVGVSSRELAVKTLETNTNARLSIHWKLPKPRFGTAPMMNQL